MRHLSDCRLVSLRGEDRMTRTRVVGIGNAMVDVICQTSDTFLDLMGITKGIMQLVERDRSETLYAAMGERTEEPGGSVGNTIAGVGKLGLEAAFIGRVRDDALGRYFAAALAEEGTGFPNRPRSGSDLPTSRSMIFVTPDGERSMNTYLGISAELGPDDVDDRVIGACDFLFLAGYLFDKAPGKAAFHKAAAGCHAGGGRAGIALSDPFCVDRHRGDFRALVRDEMDYVIGNRHEWCALYQTDDLESALSSARADCPLVVCTRSGEDVILLGGTERVEVPVKRVVPVDTTGAGDQFAAGFLYGLASGLPLAIAGRMGVVAAAEVIGHIGPRPEADVLALFRQEGLI
jgi:sugar/nucleoside kinase (ribokinase family)